MCNLLLGRHKPGSRRRYPPPSPAHFAVPQRLNQPLAQRAAWLRVDAAVNRFVANGAGARIGRQHAQLGRYLLRRPLLINQAVVHVLVQRCAGHQYRSSATVQPPLAIAFGSGRSIVSHAASPANFPADGRWRASKHARNSTHACARLSLNHDNRALFGAKVAVHLRHGNIQQGRYSRKSTLFHRGYGGGSTPC